MTSNVRNATVPLEATNMKIESHRITIYTTADLNGLTGDNGEQFCVFVRNFSRPLDSGWRWFATRPEAVAYATEIAEQD